MAPCAAEESSVKKASKEPWAWQSEEFALFLGGFLETNGSESRSDPSTSQMDVCMAHIGTLDAIRYIIRTRVRYMALQHTEIQA